MNTAEFSESDLTKRGKAHESETQSREVKMPMKSSDLDKIEKAEHLSSGRAPRTKGRSCSSITALLIVLLLGCAAFSVGDRFRVPVSEAAKVADTLKAAFTTSDIDGDGFIDDAEWALVTNVVIAEAVRLSRFEE